MLLLNPIWLLLGLAAVPILLIHAQRQRRQVVSSLTIWRTLETASTTAPRFALPRLTPSLLVQLAILAAITLAAADLRLVPDDLPEHTVLVIDSSANMSTGEPSAFEAARVEAQDIIEAFDAAGTGMVSVVSVEGEAHLLAARRDRPATALAKIDDLTITDQRPDWAGVARWLDTIISPDEPTQVHVISTAPSGLSDHFAAGDRVSVSATEIEQQPDILLRVDGLTYDRDNGHWDVTGRVIAELGSAMPTSVSVYYAREGDAEFLDWGTIDIIDLHDSDAQTTGRFAARLSLPGDGRIVIDAVRGSHDAAHRHFAVLDTAPPDILFVGNPAPLLVRALQASGAFAVAERADLPFDADSYDLVILNGPRTAPGIETNVLHLGASAIDANQQPGEVESAELSGWNTQHPLSRDVDWQSLEAISFVEGGLPPGLEMVAQTLDGIVLGTRTTATGRHVYLKSEVSDEGWTQQAAFPILISNMVRWMGLATPASCVAGIACELDRHQRVSQIISPDGSVVYDGTLLSGASRAIPDVRFRPRQAGFHAADASVIAVNSARQSAAEQGAGSFEPWAPDATLDFWRGLIVLALAFLVVELLMFLSARRLVGESLQEILSRHRVPVLVRGLTIAALGAGLAPLPVPLYGPAGSRVAVANDAEFPIALDEGAIRVVANAPLLGGGRATSDARAIELAQAIAPLPPRLALADDMAQVGRLSEHVLAGGGPRVDIVPSSAAVAADVSVFDVVAPANVAIGETYRVTGLIESDRLGDVRLITLRNGLPVDSRQLSLEPGITRADVVLTPTSLEDERIEMVLEAGEDGALENNLDAAFVAVSPPSPILVVARDDDQGEAFRTILANQDMEVAVVAPNAAPRTLEGWLAYDGVVLLDVPARDLRFEQIEQLQDAVETFGKGLVLAGDANAFGAGGYYGTPLEELSPLSSRVPHDRPQTAIVFVVDRSGSMDAPVGPVTRLDLAKAALTNAADLMESDDLIGIIGFDDAAQTVVSLRQRGDAPVGPLIANVVPGGGTALVPALDEAISVLEGAGASLSHIVVITDGLVEPVDFSSLLERARAAEITISTVAAGSSAVTDRLERIAEAGGGVYYATRDFQTLPAILMQDIMTLDEPLVVDDPARVEVADDGARLGLNVPTLPSLSRHVKTTPKNEVQMTLRIVNAEGDTLPLAANWRYGAGTVAAFAMNPGASTAETWAELPGFPRLWSQSLRDVLSDVAGPGLNLRTYRRDDGFDVWAEIIGVDGQAVAGGDLVARLLERDAPIDMVEVAPGQYFGGIDEPAIGPNTLTVSVGDIVRQATLFEAYPAHLRHHFGDPRGLDPLAVASGGAVLERGEALPPIEGHWMMRHQAWPWLTIALAIFLIDLLARRRWRPRRP